MADNSGRTEQPTQRRLQKARQEGQFPSAREFVAALQFLIFLGVLAAGSAPWFGGFRRTIRALFLQAFAGDLSAERLSRIAWQVFWMHFLPLVLGGLAVALGTLAIRLITTRFGLSLKKLAPDLKRLDPIAKLRELPRQNLPSLIQALFLLPLFLGAVYAVAHNQLDAFMALPLQSAESGSLLLWTSLMELFWKAAGVFLVFGSIDLIRQMRRYRQDLRMSKQEIREEMKDV